MENRKGSGIFLGIIGVATLVVAIIGATFAYFSATAQSNADAVTVQSATLALGYEDDNTGLKTNLIPADDNIAIYAGTQQDSGSGNPQCIDDNGNEVCSIYQFTVGNPSKTTAMNISGRMEVATNDFANLKFAVYEMNEDSSGNLTVGAEKIGPTAIATGASSAPHISLALLNTQLLASSEAADAEATLDPTAPLSYTLHSDTVNSETLYNRRTYRMILWVHNLPTTDQTDIDASKSFAAQIVFDTGSGSGVSGVLAAAAAPAEPTQP